MISMNVCSCWKRGSSLLVSHSSSSSSVWSKTTKGGNSRGGAVAASAHLTRRASSSSSFTFTAAASASTRLRRTTALKASTITWGQQQRAFASTPTPTTNTNFEIRTPMKPFSRGSLELKPVPSHIPRPPYAETGKVPFQMYDNVYIHDLEDLDNANSVVPKMRAAARLARNSLDLALSLAKPGVTTDQIDTAVHEAICQHGAYPSPLNYANFPKSICSSINEVICHGIPDTRPLQYGDVVSFDVSCFLNGVHGDNCATIIVGDDDDDSNNNTADPAADPASDWRGVPYKTTFASDEEREHFENSRRLVRAAHVSLQAAIDACRRPDACLSDIGQAIHSVVYDQYGYQSVEKYRGHGICQELVSLCPLCQTLLQQRQIKVGALSGVIFTIEHHP